MGSVRKDTCLSSSVTICATLLFFFLFTSFCDARSINIQQVTEDQSSDEHTQYHLIENDSSSQSTIVKDEPQSSYAGVTNSGVIRTLREQTPSTYLLEIKDFSELKSKPGNYESATFNAVGFKWRMSFYQNGNSKDGGKDHISLYVRIENLPTNSEVDVELKLFVYNYHQDKYLTVQDGHIKRLSGANTQWGLGQFLPSSTFNDPSSGYIVNDTCLFGVEIFLIKPTEKREILSFIYGPAAGNFTWKIQNFSKLGDVSLHSPLFLVGERYWKLIVHPMGYGTQKGKMLAVFLFAWSYPPNAVEVKTYGSAKLLLLNQQNSTDIVKQTGGWYNIYPYISYGANNIISLGDLYNESNGYLVDDKIIVQTQFIVASVTKVVNN